uniref:Piscidin n=1 Tax=Sebastiscus marmoratus TaxID=41446 RepID=A0A5C1K3G5_SEBMA|nr:piscidin [Sebastiscus marmoratus]
MKFAMIFLVLTLVVLLAEPGECFFKRIKAAWKGARQAWKDYKYNRNMQKMNQGYGQQGGNPNPPPEQSVEEPPPYMR